MMTSKTRFCLLLFLCWCTIASGQMPPTTCISKTELEDALPADHAYHSKQLRLNKAWSTLAASDGVGKRASAKYTLPVVFHIIHDNGPENISDARVQRALDYLNLAFANEGYYDQQAGVDTEIQFCLAKTDENNQATSGINRVVSSLTQMVMQTEDIAMKDLSRWDPLSYINIWIVEEITSLSAGPGVAGYAYFPSAHGANFDGIVIEARHTGFDESNGSILVHEMGHYLGLYHTFEGGCQNDDCTQDGDLVCDTPPDQSTGYVPCQQGMNTCNTDVNSGFQNDVNDQIENYMDYSELVCYNQFSPMQAERMQFHIEEARVSLLDSRACFDPCVTAINANFTFPNSVSICDSITVINQTTNADLYYWYLNSIFISDQFEPRIAAPTLGRYILELKAYSSDSSCLETRSFSFDSYCPAQAEVLTQIPPCVVTIDSVIELSADTEVDYTYAWYVNGNLESSNPSFSFAYPAGVNEVKLVTSVGKCADSVFVNILVGCVEICDNEIDDDGDGLVDCFDDDCCLACPDFYFDACAPEECPPTTTMDIQQKWRFEQARTLEYLNLTCGDVDGDGDVEFVCRNGFGGDGFYIISNDGVLEAELDAGALGFNSALFEHAIADVDRDGTGEIFFVSEQSELVRMDHDGSISFVSDPMSFYQRNLFSFGIISIADLNYDKIPEVIVEQNIVDGLTGTLLFAPDTSNEQNFARGRFILADVLPDAACQYCQGLEIVSGTRIYAPSYDNRFMEIAIEIPGYAPTATAVADWDMDGDEDVIALSIKNDQQVLTVWNGQTDDIIQELTLSRFSPSGITVGNFDDDQAPEIAYVESVNPWGANANVLIRDNDLSLIWEEYEFNISFNSLGGFDFDTDGKLELFYRAQDYFRIRDPLNGAVLAEEACYSFTNNERAVLADFDGDGHAELATTCDNALVTFEGITEWPGTRSVYNQYYFYNTHINDDLTVPAYYQECQLLDRGNELNSTMAHHRSRVYPEYEFAIDVAELYCSDGQTLAILNYCQFENVQEDSVAISIYAGNPSDPMSSLVTTYNVFISADPVACLTDTIVLAMSNADSFYFLINDDGSATLPFNVSTIFPITTLSECDYSDNVAAVAFPMLDHALDELMDTFLCLGNTIDLALIDVWYSYLWSTGETTSFASVQSVGQHWVEVTDECGAKIRDSFFVAAYTSPPLNLPDTIESCMSSVHFLDAGHFYDSYEWSTLETTSSITVFDPGIYWVEVVDSCGDSQFDTTVVILTQLADLNLPDTVQLCDGDTFQLLIPFFDEIVWETNAYISCLDCADPFLFPPVDQSFAVYAYNNDGCSVADTIFVEVVDEIEAFDTIGICAQDSILYRGNYYVPGPHSILLTSTSGCDTLLNLFVDSTLTNMLDIVGYVCEGDSFFIYNQYFSPGFHQFTLSGSGPACDTLVMLEVVEYVPPSFDVVALLDSCGALSTYTVTLHADVDLVGVLTGDSSSQTGSEFYNVEPGQYTLSVQDSLMCWQDTTIVLDSIDFAAFDLVDTLVIDLGDTAFAAIQGDLSLIESIVWEQNNTILCDSCAHLIALPELSQSYQVVFTDVYSCVHELTVFVEVIDINSVYIPNAFSPNNDGVNDVFKPFSSEIKQLTRFAIYNRWGARIYYRDEMDYADVEGWDGTFKNQEVDQGLYVYVVDLEMKNGRKISASGEVLILR